MPRHVLHQRAQVFSHRIHLILAELPRKACVLFLDHLFIDHVFLCVCIFAIMDAAQTQGKYSKFPLMPILFTPSDNHGQWKWNQTNSCAIRTKERLSFRGRRHTPHSKRFTIGP